MLPSPDVPESFAIIKAIFLQHDPDVLAPFWDETGRIELNGIGCVGIQGVIAAARNTLLHVPHADGGTGCMAMQTEGMGIDAGHNAGGRDGYRC